MDPASEPSRSPVVHEPLDDVHMAPPVPPPPVLQLSSPSFPARGAYLHRSHASGTTRPTDYPPDYRHTSPLVPRPHDARHAPYPPPAARRSHTPRTPVSPEEEDIGSSDSSSNSSDYSSDSDASRDELDDDDVPSQPPKSGFGFSAATWSSTNPSPNPPSAPPISAPYERERVRTRDRPRIIYQDTHYEKKDVHYVMEEHHRSSRYYPPPHPHHPPPSTYITREHRTYSGTGVPYPPRRSSISPERSFSSHRRPVSPEPLYTEYREYRDNRHHRERERERERERGRERERAPMTSRSSQTSPVRVDPIHPIGPRTFVRKLTPSRYRRPLPSPISDVEHHESRWERDQDRERKLEREREEREEREREREREKQREIQRAKYQYESRVPPPPASLSAPLTLRPPPPAREQKTLMLSRGPRAGAPRSAANGTNPLSSNAHTATQFASAQSPPAGKPITKRGTKTSRDAFAPPRMVIPGPGGRKAREDEEYDLGEEEMDEEDDEEYQPLPKGSTATAPPTVAAAAASASTVPRRTNSMNTKRAGLLAGGSSTSTFALSGGPSAPANNNGTTSTTTTFHVTTPRAISASLAAAQNASSQSGGVTAQVEAEKAEAEKMRIPSFKRGGKTRYQCVYCTKDFSRKNDAYRHMSRKHNDNATEFICVCGRVLSRGDALTRHMRTCRESKEKGSTGAVVTLTSFGGGVHGGTTKAAASVMGAAGKKKGGKKRKSVSAGTGAGAGAGAGGMEMDVDGEEELIDDVSMEEED
ncbi:hypothetical protein C0995_009718 [Termitomyces sp. Mi166|nr:hypothetical protein C0995_009718 [Termitomyces sp. Mi166\